MDSRGARRKLITEAFLRLFVVNMFMIVAQTLNVILDGIFIGQLLGTESLAAVGFLGPYLNAVGITIVLSIGTQILIGNHIGAGEKEKVNQLFFGSFICLSMISIIITLLSIIFRFNIATVLGADGEVRELLAQYMLGFVPGTIFSVLGQYFTAVISYNNELKKSYIAIAVMMIVNVTGDITLTPIMGIFGIGLASSISAFASFLVLLSAFTSKNKVLSLHNVGFNRSLLIDALIKGLPLGTFNFGIIIKNYLINTTLNTYAGAEGVAVTNVFNTVTSFICFLPVGCYNAYLALSVIYYGDDDRESFIDLTKIAFRYGCVCCIAFSLVMMSCHRLFALLFFEKTDPAYSMASLMLLIMPIFLTMNLIFYMFVKAYQAQGLDKFVNIISMLDPAFAGVYVFFAVPVFGINAAWFGLLVSSVVGISIIIIYVAISKKRFSLALEDLLMLRDNFGAPAGTFAEYSLNNIEDVTGVSEEIIDFLKSKGVDTKQAMYVGLCAEELANNILHFGFEKKKKHFVDIRVVKRDSMSLRFRDDCREFDPRLRMDSLNPKEPEKNIGMRIVSKMACDVSYYNNAGINTLLLKF